MSSETEIERLIVRLMGDGTAYQKMLEQATTVTDQLGQEMKRLGGTEAEFTAITARAAKVTEDATQALGRHNWEQRRLQGLLDVGRISEESYERQVAKTGSVLDTATSSLTKHAEAVARGLQITRASETQMERYKRQIAELDKLFAMTAITQEAYNRTAEALNAKLPRTIALEKERVAAIKAIATAQKEYEASQKRVTDAINQGAAAERRMIAQDHKKQIAAGAKALEAAAVAANNFGRDISRAGLTLRGFGTSWAIYVTAPLGAFLVASTMAGVKMDSMTRGLTAVTHSAAKTKKQLEDMREVAMLPGLGFKEAVEGHIRLQATGFAATTSKRALLAFGNALATVGKGKADLDGVVLALSQISAKGKVMAQEINQLGERVPQIRKIMEEAFGTADTEKIQRMGLSSKEFIEMIVTELEKLPKVTGGALNDLENFSDAAFVAFSKVGTSILTVLRPAIITATDLLNYLGDSFKYLSTPMQLGILGMTGFAAAIGPIAIIAGQATLAIGGLITVVGYLTASVSGLLLVIGALHAAIVGLVAVAIIYATYELLRFASSAHIMNAEMERSNELSAEMAAGLKRTADEAIMLAEAMETVAKKKFLAEKLATESKVLNTYETDLKKARAATDKHATGLTGKIHSSLDLTGELKTEIDALQDATKKFETQTKIVEDLRSRLASAEAGPSQLETIKQTTALRRETDNYIKSLERKIEVLARGEAATKLADLASRHEALGMKFNAEAIQALIDKEQELKDLKAAKAKSADVIKDVDTLTKKLEAQVATFGKAKEADDIFALAERGATDAMLAGARAASEKLKVLKEGEVATKKAAKETEDLTKDITTFTDKLASEIATFGMLSEEAELYALAARGASDAELVHARALAAKKKELTENKKLMDDALKITEKRQPLVKFTNDYRELAKMFDIGAISADTLKKQTKELEKELTEAQEKADVRIRFTVEGNEAVRAGSAEFTKMIADVERRTKNLRFGANVAEMQKAINSEFTKVEPEIPSISVATITAEDIEPTHTFTVDGGTGSFTVDGEEKTLPVLERVALGIEELVRNPRIVLSAIGD